MGRHTGQSYQISLSIPSLPAAGAAQLSRNFQDKHLQGCPPLDFGSLTAHCKPFLHITNYNKLYYPLL